MTKLYKQDMALAAYLERNLVITPMQALSQLGIYRLSARIHSLRAAGYNIITVRSHPHAIYRLEPRP
jgi:hypothetical protein